MKKTNHLKMFMFIALPSLDVRPTIKKVEESIVPSSSSASDDDEFESVSYSNN